MYTMLSWNLFKLEQVVYLNVDLVHQELLQILKCLPRLYCLQGSSLQLNADLKETQITTLHPKTVFEVVSPVILKKSQDMELQHFLQLLLISYLGSLFSLIICCY